MSLRDFTGYTLLAWSRLLKRIARFPPSISAVPETFALIVWTSREMDRHSKASWNSWEEVERVAQLR